MQGKPNWKQYRQQLQAKLQALRPKRQAKPNATPSKWRGNLRAQWQKLRGKLRTLPQQVREKPQLLAVAAVVAGCLLLLPLKLLLRKPWHRPLAAHPASKPPRYRWNW